MEKQRKTKKNDKTSQKKLPKIYPTTFQNFIKKTPNFYEKSTKRIPKVSQNYSKKYHKNIQETYQNPHCSETSCSSYLGTMREFRLAFYDNIAVTSLPECFGPTRTL